MKHTAMLPLFLSTLLLFSFRPASSAQDSTLLSGVAVLTKGVASKRVSSWDKTGGNGDDVELKPGETLVIADIKGVGAIKHFWMTMASDAPHHLRELVLRMYWDGEKNPSVESPLGDFFGTGFGEYHSWHSLPLTVHNRALNCYFEMPFSSQARIELTNEGAKAIPNLYFQVDYEQYADAAMVADRGRFHAQWRHRLAKAVPKSQSHGVNLTGEDNYVFMEAEGRGQYVGTVMNVEARSYQFWGEGDDMFFIDGATLPSLNGTGTEDYFSNAFGFQEEVSYLFNGYSRKGNQEWGDWGGRHTMYRFHLQDPIRFDRSLRATIEHGSANVMEMGMSSVAYWYQTEPHKKFDPFPPVNERMPNSMWKIQDLDAPLPTE
jgi:hypothetical protein